jgi:hypothetical protein
MHPKTARDLQAFIESAAPECLRNPPQQIAPAIQLNALTSMLALLWETLHAVAVLKYEPTEESDADRIILIFARNEAATAEISPGAARVILERIMQAIAVLGANTRIESGFITMPGSLPEKILTGALLLWWLLRMELPFSPVDRSTLKATSKPETHRKAKPLNYH